MASSPRAPSEKIRLRSAILFIVAAVLVWVAVVANGDVALITRSPQAAAGQPITCNETPSARSAPRLASLRQAPGGELLNLAQRP